MGVNNGKSLAPVVSAAEDGNLPRKIRLPKYEAAAWFRDTLNGRSCFTVGAIPTRFNTSQKLKTMNPPTTELLIHEGACIHYLWKPGCPASATDPKVYPEVVITSVKRGDTEMLNLLESIGSIGEQAIESFIAAVLAENEGRA